MYSRAEPAFSSGCGYSSCSVWQSVQLAPMAPWTDAAQASGSIVMSFDEPSLNETVEPGCPWQSRHSWARAGAPRSTRADPRSSAAARWMRFIGGPPGIGHEDGGDYFIVAM